MTQTNGQIRNFVLHAIDFYKSGHIKQYIFGTTEVYANFTPRSIKHLNVEKDLYDGKIVNFGLQAFIKSILIEAFDETFFNQPLEKVLNQYKRRMDTSLFTNFDVSHIEALHKLGYLPLRIKALPEGVKVKPGVPVFTIVNTLPEFYWLTNYLESVLSVEIWKKMVNATIASHYRGIFVKFAKDTGAPLDFVGWQGHDFSMRGMSGWSDAAMSGMAHLTSFVGTDTVGAIDALEQFYNANADVELIAGSVPATEHSVMCLDDEADERETFRRLIADIYPTEIVSIVSDSRDFWKVINVVAPSLKKEIMARTSTVFPSGKVVFRPDSGDPVRIICGYKIVQVPNIGKAVVTQVQRYEALMADGKYYLATKTNGFKEISEAEALGAVRVLARHFGTTTTDKGYMVLDSHVGLIYGDSITPNRANRILTILKEMGYASCNVVFGIGSYTYNYSTRDSIGGAMKTTSGVVNGVRREVFKDPVTDSGVKRSAKGLLRVDLVDGEYVLFDQQTEEQEKQGALEIVYENGKLLKEVSLADIRARLM